MSDGSRPRRTPRRRSRSGRRRFAPTSGSPTWGSATSGSPGSAPAGDLPASSPSERAGKVAARQSSRFSRMIGRLALRVAEATNRFGARRLGIGGTEVASRGAPHRSEEADTPGAAVPPGISDAQLRELVAANVVIDVGQRQIIAEVLSAGARHVREVMVPRLDAIFVAAADPVDVALARVLASRHSRFPVIDGSHDDVVGFVAVWDLLLAAEPDRRTVGELARPLHHIPGSKRVLAALSDMRREGHHLAVVVDEYGQTDGIVTLEDLVEELVGEVHGDGDDGSDGELGIDGRTNLNDFAERCGFPLPAGPYETVGGFVMARLGRLPHPGDEVAVGGRRLVVTECEGRRVSRVSVRLL